MILEIVYFTMISLKRKITWKLVDTPFNFPKLQNNYTKQKRFC